MTIMEKVLITEASHEHFIWIAKLHSTGITEGFLSSLGTRFLSVLYRGIARSNYSGVMVAIEQDKVIGFISYTKDIKICYRELLRSEWPALAVSLLPNIAKPSVYRRILETLRYPKRQVQRIGASPDTSAELLSMAVGSDARGKGVGKLLVNALDQEMSRLGVVGYQVVTHGIDERSNAFYVSCGFVRISEFVNHGKPMVRYYRIISPQV
jgi:GNAT superfamily N-acetyltransferase